MIFNLILIPFYYQFSKNIKKYIPPLKLVLFSLILLGILITPSLAAKTKYSFRIQNVVFYYSLIITLINFFNLSIFLREQKWLQIRKTYTITYFILSFLIFSYLLNRESTFRTVYSDILFKKVNEYDQQLTYRYNIINNSKSDTVFVQPLKTIPKSIYISDIAEDNEHWINSTYNQYFGKVIILEGK